MRTTLDVAEDVLLAAKERARAQHRSIGAVLSDAARVGLTAQAQPDLRQSSLRHGFRVLGHRGQVISNEAVNRLRDDEGV